MSHLDYEPPQPKPDNPIPVWLWSGAGSAVTIALLGVGLWDLRRGGQLLDQMGLLPLFSAVAAVVLGLGAALAGPLRRGTMLAILLALLVTWLAWAILGWHWAG